MSKQVVILGGGVGGISTAHKLLKNTLPKVKDLKVILVSASSHLYWNIAAVRGVLPDEIDDGKLFREIAPGFSKYPSSQFEFVLGTASSLDPASNTVYVDTPQGDRRSIPYAHLVIATGSSTTTGLPFKLLGSYDETVSALHDLQSAVGTAESIIVAGAGPTGVEVTGELAGKYGKSKKITLVIPDKQALPGNMASVGQAAESELAKMGVELVRGARVTEVREPDGSKKKEVVLSTGVTLVADLFLPTYGVRPNTGFVPAELLDDGGFVKLQKTMKVVGLDNVWAVGDVGNAETGKRLTRVEPQVNHLATNLDAVLKGDGATGVTEYKPNEMMMIFVTVGKNKGTGQVGIFKVFSFLVASVKGKSLFLNRPLAIVEGR
jgi:NADH dehydrogenase FAD-containing subunit